MVLLFSQRLAFSMLLQGHSRIGNLADNTTRFIEDHVADFIISNGGWVSFYEHIYYFVSLVHPFLINLTCADSMQKYVLFMFACVYASL